jgi:hypothetical protein
MMGTKFKLVNERRLACPCHMERHVVCSHFFRRST